MQILVEREIQNCTETTTPGKIYLDEEYYGFTLEDARRGHGVKVAGNTCIPSGHYIVVITWSNRFKKEMLQIFNAADRRVYGEGVSFSGVRLHGGNDHVDTSGCILVAKSRINNDRIQGSLSQDLFNKVEAAIVANENVWLEVVDA